MRTMNRCVAFLVLVLALVQFAHTSTSVLSKPKIVFPYHYRNQDGTTADMVAFLSQVGNASIVRLRNRWYQ